MILRLSLEYQRECLEVRLLDLLKLEHRLL